MNIVLSVLSGMTSLIQIASSLPCLIVNGGSTRRASLSPEMSVEAMWDHVSGMSNGKGLVGRKGMRSVTWVSARKIEAIVIPYQLFSAEFGIIDEVIEAVGLLRIMVE